MQTEDDERDQDANFATIGKSLGDVISKAKQPRLTFDSFSASSGVKIAGAFSNPLQASMKGLTPRMKEMAEMIKVSTIFHKEGLESAKKRLRQFNKGYLLDTELTTDAYAVIQKPNGKVIVSFRGTDPHAKIQSGLGKGRAEPLMWLPIQAGKEDIFDQHKLAPIKEALLAKYRPDQIEHITGYSMGATKAHRLGDMMGKDTHLFNPFIGKKFFDTPNTPNTKHQIVRTTEDLASSLRVFKNKRMPKNVKVDSIDPINTVKMAAKNIHSRAKTDLQSFNLLDNHNLEHFTADGDRSSLLRDINEQIDIRVNKFEEETRGLSKNSNEFRQRKEQMIEDLRPTMALAGQETEITTSRSKMFNSLKPSSVITALQVYPEALELIN